MIIMSTPCREMALDAEKIRDLTVRLEPDQRHVRDILDRALRLKGLDLNDAADLLAVRDPDSLRLMLSAAGSVKQLIYGRRMVLFAPLYVGNVCSNNCLYCGFRKDHKALKRRILTQEEIRGEVRALLKEGHKRLLMLCGESDENPIDYFLDAIRTAYSARIDGGQGPGASIRRINVEIAPMDVPDFVRLKESRIGTYACFQETYDPDQYRVCHPEGPKSDYEYRLTVMDRAMRGGIDDVGIGVLFGLSDYRFEVLALLEHAAHLENVFGCGPHTVSVPRIEPAAGAPLSENIPHPVSDDEFRKIVAVIRLSLPYTGMILSTRESEQLRDELFRCGISQISAGSRTNPGAYSAADSTAAQSGAQFSLGDHRSLDEVVSRLIDQGFIPSFCTGCYRKGRVGNDFMDLAKPGLIQRFCEPNALFTFREYLADHAGDATRDKGLKLIDEIVKGLPDDGLRSNACAALERINGGARDEYF